MQFSLGNPGAPGAKGERGFPGKSNEKLIFMLQIIGLCTI